MSSFDYATLVIEQCTDATSLQQALDLTQDTMGEEPPRLTRVDAMRINDFCKTLTQTRIDEGGEPFVYQSIAL